MSSNSFNLDPTTSSSKLNTETVARRYPSSPPSSNSPRQDYFISWSNPFTATCDQLSTPPSASNSTFYNQYPNSKIKTHHITPSKYVEPSPASNTVSETAVPTSSVPVFPPW